MRAEVMNMAGRTLVAALVVGMFAGMAAADPYEFQGIEVEVDYWAGTGANEALLVIDWNNTNGPYTTESHAWGVRWEDDGYFLSDAINWVTAAGALEVTTSSGGAFVDDAFYSDPLIDPDDHTSDGYTGWWWMGTTTDAGDNWLLNGGGISTEPLVSGILYGMNVDEGDWTSETLSIPIVPEPGTMLLLLAGLPIATGWRRR
jgi:hypothetical protein